jgi:hypothetical protein
VDIMSRTTLRQPEGAGVRALRFGSAYLTHPRLDNKGLLHGPLDFPDAHRAPQELGLEAADVERLNRLVVTLDAVRNADDHLLETLVRVDPSGNAVVWPGSEMPYRCFMSLVTDPQLARRILAANAVHSLVLDELQRTNTLLFDATDGFCFSPDNLLGLAYAAFALEISADARGPVCVECGTPLEDVQRVTKQYCGDRCKARARRRREQQHASASPLSAAPGH